MFHTVQFYFPTSNSRGVIQRNDFKADFSTIAWILMMKTERVGMDGFNFAPLHIYTFDITLRSLFYQFSSRAVVVLFYIQLSITGFFVLFGNIIFNTFEDESCHKGIHQ